MRKISLALAVLTVLAVPALADDATPLPSLALNPPQVEEPSPWKGLSIGAETFASFGKGAKSHIGGGGFVAYDHPLANNWSIGVSASAGFMPFSLKNAPFKGVDYGSTAVKFSYDMGQLKPYISGGLLMTRPTGALAYSGADQSLNDLFASSKDLRTSGMVGAGFDYQINSQTSIGLGLQVGTGPAVFAH